MRPRRSRTSPVVSESRGQPARRQAWKTRGARDVGDRAFASQGGAMAANIAQYFTQHLARPQHVLYRHYVDDTWRDVTVSEVAREITRWQAAFRREGLARGDRIALCARNSIAWISADLAALGLPPVLLPLSLPHNPHHPPSPPPTPHP